MNYIFVKVEYHKKSEDFHASTVGFFPSKNKVGVSRVPRKFYLVLFAIVFTGNISEYDQKIY